MIILDEASQVAKYQQIVDQVRALVANDTLAPGAQLPSVRQLAADLGINMNTVLAAYRQLEAEEIIVLRRGSRAIVHPRLGQTHVPGPADYERIRGLLASLRVEAVLAGLTLDELTGLAREAFASGEVAPGAQPRASAAGKDFQDG